MGNITVQILEHMNCTPDSSYNTIEGPSNSFNVSNFFVIIFLLKSKQ